MMSVKDWRSWNQFSFVKFYAKNIGWLNMTWEKENEYYLPMIEKEKKKEKKRKRKSNFL